MKIQSKVLANRITKSKGKITAISLLLLLVCSTALATLPIATAHTPAWTIPTYAYIVVSPDPMGIGQTGFIVVWLDKVPPTAGGTGGDRWTGFTIKVTKPDGTQQTLGPFISDATSAYATLFTPDQVGKYSFVFNFPGQVASLYHPETGAIGVTGFASWGMDQYVNDTYLPSSASTSINVQQNPVASPPTYPLPTSYWTRPIEGQNTAWSSISSNYLGGANIIDKVQPSGEAPSSAHILWTKPYQDGGIVGGDYWSVPSAAYYTGLSYEGKFNNPIIMYGRLYYDSSLSDGATNGPYTCVDLATGKTLWTNDAISPTFGNIYLYESMNQHGVIGDGYLVQTSGTTWMFYDARTGAALFNMTNVPSGFGGGFFGGYGQGVLGSEGQINNYQFSITGQWLAMWSSAAEPLTPLVATPGTTTDAYQYRPLNKNANMSKAYMWNVSMGSLPAGSSIMMAIPDDMILFSTSVSTGFFGWGTLPYTVTAISLKPYSRGQILWQKSYSPPTGNMTRSFGPFDATARVFTMTDKETMQWSGYSLDNGQLLWGPVGNFRDFQYYGQVSNPPAPGHAAYGNLYVGGYGGELHCFDMKTGAIKWIYNDTFSGDQTPWGLYTLFIAGIADGKVYCYSSEHSPNVPLYKGSEVRCIDAITGEEVWTLMSWYAIGSFGQSPVPIADGKMVYLNVYDMQLYCIGKGSSAITVDAPATEISQGKSLLIRGTVTDVSVGAKQLIEAGKFNVVPAMSDASQGKWMEYLYMQKPMPTDAIGVSVKLTAIDPNGNSQEIGTAVSDLYGNYAIAWTPPVEGMYQVIATFEGSNSYYGAAQTTYFMVGPAPAVPEPTATPTATPQPTAAPTAAPTASPSVAPPPEAAPSTDIYLIAAAAAVIIVVAAAAAVFLKKRK